jgi:hypothetical protein
VCHDALTEDWPRHRQSNRDSIRRALRDTIEAWQAAEDAQQRLRDTLAGGALVDVGGQLYYSSEPHLMLRCVATTRRGAQCRNTVFDGQEWSWHPLTNAAMMPEHLYPAIQQQRCRVHLNGAEPDAVESDVRWLAVEHGPFDGW